MTRNRWGEGAEREELLRQERERKRQIRQGPDRERVLALQRANNKRNRAAAAVRHQAWRAANPALHHAQKIRQRAASPLQARAWRLALTIPLRPCEVCGSTVDVHRHHPDYTKPKDVVMLCRVHHNEVHHGT